MSALVSVLVSVAAAPAPAAAGGWQVAQLPDASAPRAAAANATGGFTLLTSGRTPHRWSWPPGAARPSANALAAPAPPDYFETPWVTNAHGDALAIELLDAAAAFRVAAVDANGASNTTNVSGYRDLQRLPADVGEDGTAAVASELEDGAAFALSVRPPGGQWGPPVVVRGPDFIDAFTLRVLADGTVAVVFANAGRVYLTHVRAGAEPEAPVAIASAGGIAFDSNLMIAAGGDRVVVEEHFGGPQQRRLVALHRHAGTWTPARVLRTTDSFTAPAAKLAQTPDGRALLVAFDGRDLLAWRSAPGAAFGAPVRIARVKRGWEAADLAIDQAPSGDATIAWSENTDEDTEPSSGACEGPCHARVRAVRGTAAGRFGAPVVVSPLGTANLGRHIFTAIDASGERLLAWEADRTNAIGKVVTARAAPGPDLPPRADTKAPRLTARIPTLRQGRFGMKLGCGERCAVAVSLLPPPGSPEQTFISDLPIAVVNRPRTVNWRLTASQRHDLRVLLGLGSVRVFVNAVDAAGNKRTRVIPASSPE
jgi:hypothetical protein